MKNTIKISQLVELLNEKRGATFASVLYYVDEGDSRTVKGQKLLQKLVAANITLNSNYEDKVNRLLEKQGDTPDFEAKKMNGFRHIEGYAPCVVMNEKTGELALSHIHEHGRKPKVFLFYKGKPITREEAIRQNLFAPSAFAPKRTAGRGAVAEKNDFKFRNLYLKNILEIKLFGVRYRIDHSE